eukprot:CAMPEP_0202710362 /NCGR_PEP_ID=MMETSP1385-20130828/22356_1 /ASSEMBLY_ACC=CAM_ASM_000861 /TAXON_ID=933848 /ORGANISM="Elphidium margaritaceum" /LENGTH=452 /DNA_ID=CAMNT_0049369885 /DNA_START=26 /DNA_END=1384 /DNA_ORIENTATION=-
MSLSMMLKRAFSTGPKQHKSYAFVIGCIGGGKSSLLRFLQQTFAMKDKGTIDISGIAFQALESSSSSDQSVYAYNYDESTFATVLKFVSQPSATCVILVVDSRKKHILSDADGNDIRSKVKAIAKVIGPQCRTLILCNKQDLQNEDVLSPEDIGQILDINRLFLKGTCTVLGCSLTTNANTDAIAAYLTEHAIISTANDDEKEQSRDRIKSSPMFSLKKKSKKANEVVMIFGLDGVGKTSLINAFEFGKKSKTSIAVFEAETLKHCNVEFHVWNYEKRSWPMCKSFFSSCSLVIFVIDGTKMHALHSHKLNVWTVSEYLQQLLGMGAHSALKRKALKKSRSVPDSYDQECKNDDETDEQWHLKCPFLFYINKCDSQEAELSSKDLEEHLKLSRLMPLRGITYFIQQCSAKSKKGVYDGLVWCAMNGILTHIPEIKEYADQHNIKLQSAAVNQ